MVPALIGAVFGTVATLTWDVRPDSRVVEGVVAAIDDRAVVIRLSEPAELSDRGFGIVGALWREAVPDGVVPGEWRRTASDEGDPTCLSPDDAGRTVTLGLVSDPGGSGRPVSEVVAWLECALPAEGDGP